MSYYLEGNAGELCSRNSIPGVEEPTYALSGLFDAKVTVKIPKGIQDAAASMPEVSTSIKRTVSELDAMDTTIQTIAALSFLSVATLGVYFVFKKDK